MILAHRGDSSHAPENTLEAAERGHQAGADGWELDVRLTRDGVAVVFHDSSLLRTTDVARKFPNDPRRADDYRVSDFDLDEIQTLDAGSWFADASGGHRSARAFGTLDAMSREDREHFASGSIRVPTLDEALRLTIRLDWMVNVELKSFPDGNASALIEGVVRAIRSLDMADRVLVSSFRHSDLRDIRSQLPGITTGVLTTTPIMDPEAYVRDLVQADFYHPSADVLGADSDGYRRDPKSASLDGSHVSLDRIPTFVYTVNDPGLAESLGTLGVAGLFTDDPGRIRRIWESPL